MNETELPPARKILFVGRYAILDEHVLPANSSHPTITVDAKRLQTIADNCNQRIKDTGDQIPLVLGHTDDEAMEVHQPPVVGFADNFSLAPLFNTGRQAIWADFHIYEDSISEARKYPRRSVELWASKNIIDPISLLSASTPERDLGLMKFQRKETPYRYTLDTDEEMPEKDDKKNMKEAETKVTSTDGITVEAVIAALMQTPLFKQLEAMVESAANEESDESEMPDEGKPAEQPAQDAPAMPPEGKEAAKYNEPAPVRFQEAMASGTNTSPPDMLQEKKKYQMQTETELAVKYSKLESRMSVIEAENKVLKQRDEEITLRYKKDHAARMYEALEAEGYDVDDSDKEVLENLSVENQVKHSNEFIRLKYRKAPVGTNLELTEAIKYSRESGDTLEPKTTEDVQKIAALATAQGLNFNQATAKFYGKA